ncbi:MAG TPA: hypothetical protein VKA31_09545 [Mariprofundaceae bacterium]|nr:hypothetical protein [Mariprofundaceae bacterium]
MTDTNRDERAGLNSVQNEWGQQPDDNFGYASEEERRASRGLEDWEMVEQMSQADGDLLAWFRTAMGALVVGIVTFALLAYGVYYFLFHYGFHFFSTHSGS